MKKRDGILKISIYFFLAIGLFTGVMLAALKQPAWWGVAVASVFGISFVLFYFYDILSNKPNIRRVSLNDVQKGIRIEYFEAMPAPAAFIDKNDTIIATNEAFESVFGIKRSQNQVSIASVLKVDIERFHHENIQTVEYKKRVYRMYGIPFDVNGRRITALFFRDDTDYIELQNSFLLNRPCVMIISVDNFQEIFQNEKESEKARISAAIESLIDEYISLDENVVVLKSSQDTFFVLMKEYILNEIIQNKFKILDEARQITTEQNSPISLSIGAAFGARTLSESRKLAVQSLDMSLGRGGDQATVRSEEGHYSFFGGVSKGIERKSRTKTRSVAIALRDLIMKSDKIFLMGHQYSDLDSVGAACGMYEAATLLGADAYVVINEDTSLATSLVNKMKKSKNPTRFISPEEALDISNENSLLIISDTHNKKIIESYKLYEKIPNVVVIDHHRKVVDYIDDAVIFYHEPFASSACEMVTELVQYLDLPQNLPKDYVDALLSGIMTDTKNFVMQTGVRTFEAAAYLIRMGADTVAVKSLFSDSLISFRRRARIISDAEIYDGYAISLAGSSEDSNLKVIASQAADKLLEIRDVHASFVIYTIKGVVNISARSLGEINVQTLMEKLGGGGHRNMAATQIKDISEEEAKEMLVDIIKESIQEAQRS